MLEMRASRTLYVAVLIPRACWSRGDRPSPLFLRAGRWIAVSLLVLQLAQMTGSERTQWRSIPIRRPQASVDQTGRAEADVFRAVGDSVLAQEPPLKLHFGLRTPRSQDRAGIDVPGSVGWPE